MSEMVHSKSGLEPVFSALTNIADLHAGVEQKSVYAHFTQPFFDGSREIPHAGKPREIERQRFNPGWRLANVGMAKAFF